MLDLDQIFPKSACVLPSVAKQHQLFQVQRLKLDTEAAMLELDQILRANELSISLVAAVPGLLLMWGVVRGLWLLLLAPRPPDPRREALPCR
jgi:nuclear-control-of-ATPase protein 2